MIKQLLLIFIISLSVMACSQKAQNESTKDQKKDEVTISESKVDSFVQVKKQKKTETSFSGKDADIIKKAAISFHTWYLEQVNNYNSDVALNIDIVEGVKGKCKIDYDPYFNELRSLGTISEKFLESEKRRIWVCDSFIQHLDYKEYEKMEAYDLDPHCDFLYYYYWIRSQEPISNLEITKLYQDGEVWKAEIKFYDEYSGEKSYWLDHLIEVTVELESGQYMITEINWI